MGARVGISEKAGTILFLCCGVMWFLGSFGIQDGVFGLVDTESSFLAVIGGAIAFIFKPLGFGTWQAVASSLAGFVAKEGIVSTMGVLSGLGDIGEYASSMHAQFAAFSPRALRQFRFCTSTYLIRPALRLFPHCPARWGQRNSSGLPSYSRMLRLTALP